jgi:hypothetical protein
MAIPLAEFSPPSKRQVAPSRLPSINKGEAFHRHQSREMGISWLKFPLFCECRKVSMTHMLN